MSWWKNAERNFYIAMLKERLNEIERIFHTFTFHQRLISVG